MRAPLKGLVQGRTVVLDEAVPALEGKRVVVVLEPVEEPVPAHAAMNEHATTPTLTWDDWEQARGVVHLGGNAVEDCDGLYDGT